MSFPPGTVIDPTGTAPAPTGSWGDRLYCVYAEQRTTTPGEEAWAGIGWVQRFGGGGLMVEHEGGSEAFVTDSILTTLYDMVQGCEADFAAPHFVVNGAHCTSKPVCSLVIAPFEMSSWHVGGASARRPRRIPWLSPAGGLGSRPGLVTECPARLSRSGRGEIA